MLYISHYDQLQRLVGQEAYDYGIDRNGWQQIELMADYQNTFSYDPVGNIITLTRTGNRNNSNGIEMDDLYYTYKEGTNRLTRIEDPVDPTNFTSDIDSQGENNYQYDASGNLISDQSEGIADITWNIANKISYIDRGNRPALQFFYDAGGNRIGKICDTSQTVYVRDPQGNILATYYKKTRQTHENDDTAVFLENIYLYGSARLGEYRPMKKYSPSAQRYYRTKGLRHYEITNHLGNVMATISDRKLGQSPDGDTLINYYHADLLSAQDYYPGGMIMPGRRYSSENYRFGFNGKENDNEVKGTGNQQDYGMRIYDPRAVRFLSVDPLCASFLWWTPYQFAGHTPIQAIDLDGLEILLPRIMPIPLEPVLSLPRVLPVPPPGEIILPPITTDIPNDVTIGQPKEPPTIDEAQDIDWSKVDKSKPETWGKPPFPGEARTGDPSRQKAKDRGEKSWYDEEGGEWRPHTPDDYHPEGHFDHKLPGENGSWEDVYLEILPETTIKPPEQKNFLQKAWEELKEIFKPDPPKPEDNPNYT